MKVVHAIAAGLFAGSVSTMAAQASSIVNRDDGEHTLTIVEKGASRQHVLQRDGVLERVCPAGCIVRLQGSAEAEYRLEGNEVVTIKSGFLYYTGPVQQDEPPADSAKQGRGKT